MICPECGSSKIGKRGSRDGRQKYQCKECGRFFIEGTRLNSSYSTNFKIKTMPIEQERKILMYRINLNLPVAEVATHFKCSVSTVKRLEKNYLDSLKKK